MIVAGMRVVQTGCRPSVSPGGSFCRMTNSSRTRWLLYEVEWMRIFCQAIRAATVETLGVVVVVILLFGVPAFSLQNSGATLPGQEFFETWLRSVGDRIQHTITSPGLPAAQRRHYAERRLTHYSRSYGRAATQYIKKVANEIVAETRG